jgi:hypothetical protein
MPMVHRRQQQNERETKANWRSGTGILCRDAPDIRPDNPAFFYIRYPAGYQIALPDIR